MEPEKDNEMDIYIQNRYKKSMNYYWKASKNNKKWYKWTRTLTVIIGALLTLIASLSSSSIIEEIGLQTVFDLATPILAAFLTIVAGFSQSFQWGSTWQNMILTAQQLEKEYDRFSVTPIANRNYEEEAEKLNRFVIKESEGFFDRMLGTGIPSTKKVVEEEKGD